MKKNSKINHGRNKNVMKQVFIVSVLFIVFNVSASQGTLSLKDALDAALERSQSNLNTNNYLNIEEPEHASWLDGVPTVSAAFLKSQEPLGSDEAELGLAFPIKSMQRRKIEKQLVSNLQSTKETAQRQHSLYLSGILRELAWSYQIAEVSIDSTLQKQVILDGLMDRFEQLAEATAIPQYVLLLLEKEYIDNELLLLEYKTNTRNILAQFYAVTGLHDIPTDLSEPQVTVANALLHHPDLAAVDTAWGYFSQSLHASNNNAQPWQVKLTAKRVKVPEFSDNQIGVGFEVPFSIGNDYSTLQSIEYTKAKNDYEVQRHKLLTSLQLTLQQNNLNLEYLEQKQVLLDKSATPIQALEQIIPALLKSNIDNKDILIRHALEVVEARARISSNRLAIKKQISMLRQAAGISL